MIPLLQSERVLLREWRPHEGEEMHRWLANPDVTRYFDWGANTFADSVRHLEECVAEQELDKRKRYYLAVEWRATHEVIGDAGFTWIDESQQVGDLGYFLLPPYWGKGLGTECARLVLELAFAYCEALMMHASCDERNLASEGVMKHCGMQRLQQNEKLGRRCYGITRLQWLAATHRA